MSHRDPSIAIKQALTRSLPNTKVQSQLICFNKYAITLHHNQNRVSILTNVFEVYILQGKTNRGFLQFLRCYLNHMIKAITLHIIEQLE